MGGLGVAAPCASMLLWPSMLPWALAICVPVLLAWWALRHARLVRWGAIDLIARAAHAAGISRSGLPWLLTTIRALLVASVVLAATRPFVGRSAPVAGELLVAGNMTRRIEIVRRDGGRAGSLLAIERATEAVAKAARGTAIPPAVHAVTVGEAARPSADQRVIVLGDDLFPLPAPDATRIGALVRDGASMLVCLGPGAVSPSAMDRVSAWLGDLAGVQVAGVISLDDEPIEVVDDGLDTDRRGILLSGPGVRSAAELMFKPGTAAVIARASVSGRPLVVEVPVGRGRVCVSAVPLSLPMRGDSATEWSDIAAWPAFVPFLDGLMTRLLDPDRGNGPPSRSPSLPLARLLVGFAIMAALVDMVLSARRSGAALSEGGTRLPEQDVTIADRESPWRFRRAATLKNIRDDFFHGQLARVVTPRAALFALLLTMGIAWGGVPSESPAPPVRDRPVAIVIDVSPSMATEDVLGDGPESAGTNRLTAVIDALCGDRPEGSVLDRLARAWRVDVHACGSSLRSLGRYSSKQSMPDLRRLESVSPEIDGSRLADAVIDLVDRDLSAVVLATDGAITSGASWPEAAAVAARRGVPLIVIPVGSDATSSAGLPAGFRFRSVEAPAICRPGEVITIPARAIASTIAGSPLKLHGEGGGALSVDSTATPSGYVYRGLYDGSIDSSAAGLMQTIEVAAVAEGSDAPRHAVALPCIVAEDRIRVLLVDDGPRFEFRFLERLLGADERFALTTRLLGLRTTFGTRHEAGLPETVEEWSEFDIVILGDVPIASADQTAVAWNSLHDAVAREGLGVAWLPGRRWATSDAGALSWLPVVPDAAAGSSADPSFPMRLQILTSSIASDWFPFDGLASDAVADVAATTYSQISKVTVQPTARVLAMATGQAGHRMPAIVVDRLGRGTILGALCDTWRWREGPALDLGATPHARFWMRALPRLAEPRRLARLTPLTLAVRPLDPVTKEPVRVDVVPTRPTTDLASWRLEVVGPDGLTRDMSLPAVPPGATATVRLEGLVAGRYRLRLLRLPSSSHPTESPSEPMIEREIVVNKPFFEIAPSAAGVAPMRVAIEEAGGGVVPLDHIDSLPVTIDSAIASARGSGADAARWLESRQAAHVMLTMFVACCTAAWWPLKPGMAQRGDHGEQAIHSR